MDTHQPEKVPLFLAVMGVMPLALISLLPPVQFAKANLFGFIYLTLAYSFLGGTYWGIAIDTEEHPDEWSLFFSVIPVLSGLCALYLYSLFTVLHTTLWAIMIIAFIWQCILDCRLIKQGVLPFWYRRVRVTSTTMLVIFASVCVIRMVVLR